VPIVLILLGVGVVGYFALMSGLNSSATRLIGPPYSISPSDKGRFVATFANMQDAIAFAAELNQKDPNTLTGYPWTVTTPSQALANNNEVEFAKMPNVAAWVSWYPGSSYQISGVMNGVWFYKPAAALM